MPKIVLHEPEKEMREFELQPGVYSLGREANNDIVLFDKKASRKHARIRYAFQGPVLTVEDLDSSNGTYLNGSKIAGEKDLRPRDEIRIGLTRITLEAPELEEALTELIADVDDDRTQMMDFEQTADRLGKQTSPIEKVLPEETMLFEGPSDRTVALVDVRPDQPNYPKLVVVSKTNFGDEYILSQIENQIGRSPDCSIQIEDSAISGHHATIMRMESGRCVIRDMGGKNGTRVAGKRVKWEKNLKIGDEISVGSTRFKYIGSDTVLTKAQIQTNTKGKRRRLLLVAMAVMAFGLFYVGVLQKKTNEENIEPTQKATAVSPAEPDHKAASDSPPPSADGNQETVETEAAPSAQAQAEMKVAQVYFAAAGDFMENLLWAEALDKYQSVLKLRPDFPGIQERIKEAEFELENERVFEEGLSLITNQDLESAVETFAHIPEQSVYYPDAQMEANAAREQINALASEQETSDTILEAPSESEDRQDAQFEAPPVASIERPPVATAEEITAFMDQALQLYTTGEIDQALVRLDQTLNLNFAVGDPLKPKTETLKAKMSWVKTLYAQGLKEYQSGRSSQAFQTWAQVLELDQQIVGGQSSYVANEIAAQIASEYSNRAQRAFDAGEYAQAREIAAKALKAIPDHAGALDINRRLTEKARKIYEEAYILEDLSPSQAVEKWREILSFCPPESEYYRKAQTKIEKYAR